MPLRIEDYALIGDTQTVGLVGRDGSLDWLCLPRFDSGACFAALLGAPSHGRWLLAPDVTEPPRVRRRYREGTLVLETTFTTPGGTVRVVDCMPPRARTPDVVRLVEGVEGRVRMRMELVLRFDYGSVVPWVRKRPGGGLTAIAGPDAVCLDAPVVTRGEGLTTVAEFTVSAGERVPFVLAWYPAHEPAPTLLDAVAAVEDTTAWWREWSSACGYRGPWREAVCSSLMVLKALTYAPTGGIVAAATTSLPEWPGGVRNWDYRYCWLRDATFTLQALLTGGYRREAAAWRDWLLRSVAGDPSKLQIMYGVAGERRLTEYVADWLPGYEGAAPVRVGNAAVRQLQLDVYGEVMDALHQTRRAGLPPEPASWSLQRALLDFLEGNWERADEGLWEVRGPRQHFTHSKVMAWVAFDRALKAVEAFGLDGPVERWRRLRDGVHAEVCARAWDGHKRAFTQAYGSSRLDASLLLIPQVGFLPPGDARVRGTVAAIERELLRDGFVLRYETADAGATDGLPPGEGAFLACTFWLADAYALMGRTQEARALFERLLALRNDVGLLSEEYDPVGRRLLGNLPQAFSHVGLVNTAFNLTPEQPTPAAERQGG
jgi:GH15 family glucan-1,4-alpha-glucosidase